ncbi:MAG: GNAT family N-acetyltransferase [Nitrosomonadaceae bacterium]
MSRTINLIEINSLSYKELRTLMNNNPVSHLEEVPFGNFQLELDLVDEVYDYSEQAGYVRCYGAFADGEYAGYMLVMASEMVHHRDVMQAVTDSFYIKPAYRSAGVFRALLEYVEEDLNQHGVRFLTLGMNPNMPHVDKMIKYVHDKGYMYTETSLTKELL